MLTTSNRICQLVPEILYAHGVKDVVLSPGTRNAPLITAFNASTHFRVTVIVDERSAGFVALGLASVTRRPVAIVCTSGTALYNYGPALAEAYYRHIPLIAISADRPYEWIDQDDSQTLVQPDALPNIVKRSFALPMGNSSDQIWCAERMLNDAMICAANPPEGPVHINIPIAEPIDELVEVEGLAVRQIEQLAPLADFTTTQYRQMAAELSAPKRVMIVAGFMDADMTTRKAVSRLACIPNVAVLAENISNLWGVERVVGNIDATLSLMTKEQRDELAPDIVISVGGALVSRNLKEYLRSFSSKIIHWRVGVADKVIDCFRSLTKQIYVKHSLFLRGVASGLQKYRDNKSDYGMRWQRFSRKADKLTSNFSSFAPWSDFKVYSTIMQQIPRDWNLHLSNGMAIRYSQIFSCLSLHSVSCNRGVSGIDGSTSTALGASLAYQKAVTLLITGDMSALYDIGALFNSSVLTPRFKIVIVVNGGGEIFRVIKATRNLPDLDSSIALTLDTPFGEVAEQLGFASFEAENEKELADVWPQFVAVADKPALMVVRTDGKKSASTLIDFYKYLREGRKS